MAHSIGFSNRTMASVFSRNNATEQSLVSHQYEEHRCTTIHGGVGLRMSTTSMGEHGHRASAHPDYRYVSVDAGADLETKKSSAPSARLT